MKKIETLKINDFFYVKNRKYEILEISDTHIKVRNTLIDTTSEYRIEDIRKLNFSLLDSHVDYITSALDKIKNDYKYIIVDIEGNIAASKISQHDYTEKASKSKDKDTFWKENIKLIMLRIDYHEKIDDFLSILGIMFMGHLRNEDFCNLISSISSFTDFKEKYSTVYKNTTFKK